MIATSPSPSALQKVDADDSQEAHDALLARPDVQEAISRLEDLMTGRVKGISMEEYRAIIHEHCRPRGVC